MYDKMPLRLTRSQTSQSWVLCWPVTMVAILHMLDPPLATLDLTRSPGSLLPWSQHLFFLCQHSASQSLRSVKVNISTFCCRWIKLVSYFTSLHLSFWWCVLFLSPISFIVCYRKTVLFRLILVSMSPQPCLYAVCDFVHDRVLSEHLRFM